MLNKLSSESPKLFEEIVNIGSLIEKYSKDEDLPGLSSLIESNKKHLNYLSCFVKEAFLSALNFKYFS